MGKMSKKQLTELILSIFSYYGRPVPDKKVLPFWWDDLGSYSLAEIEESFRLFRLTGSKYPPNSGELLCLIEQSKNSGEKYRPPYM